MCAFFEIVFSYKVRSLFSLFLVQNFCTYFFLFSWQYRIKPSIVALLQGHADSNAGRWVSFKVWLEVFWTRRTFLVCILELIASLIGYPIVSKSEEINNLKWCLTLWLVHDKLLSFVSCEQLICFVYLFPSFTFF